jgi:hypothetical protein
MSFYDDASLVFLPSGGAGKDGKAYSMKPTNGDGDFTFSRGSNLTSTRVDSNGLIEKGRENLLLQSNQFDTTWTTSNASVTSGQSGYDGSTDAWLLEADSDGSGRRVQQSKTQGGVATLSIYAKAGTTDWLRIEFGGAASLVYFDLTNGVLGSETNAIGKIESVGNGWYRCSAVNTGGSTPTTMRYHLASDNNNITAVTGDNIYIQDAQLEIGLVATEYIESGATTGLAGILEDSPRFDYSGGASCPSLLLEPSRTNIVPISEGIAYSEGQVTTTINYGTSPEGLQNSLKVQKNGNSENDRLFPIGNGNATLVSGTDYSLSAFIKDVDMTNGAVTSIACRVDGGTLFRQGYEWNNGTLSTTTYNQSGTRTSVILEDYGNGWYRVGFSFEANGTSGNFEIDVDRFNASATTSIETYGWQFEEGSYSSSYIPNHSGGSETRNADETQELILDDDLTSVVLFGEITAIDVVRDSSERFLEMGKSGTAHNAFYVYRNHSTNERRATFYTRNDSGTQTFIAEAPTDRVKFAMQYNAGNGSIKVYVNGSNALASPITDTDYTEFEKFKLSGVGGVVRVHQFIALKATYTNAELAALTTL